MLGDVSLARDLRKLLVLRNKIKLSSIYQIFERIDGVRVRQSSHTLGICVKIQR